MGQLSLTSVQRVINNAAAELMQTVGADAMSFQFCQVGNDMQGELHGYARLTISSAMALSY